MEDYQVDTFSVSLRNARQNMQDGPNFIPLEFVRRVRLHGGVEAMTAVAGHDLATPEGQEQLQFNVAMYIECADACLSGVGHIPYQLFPQWGEPVNVDKDGVGDLVAEDIIAEEEEDSELEGNFVLCNKKWRLVISISESFNSYTASQLFLVVQFSRLLPGITRLVPCSAWPLTMISHLIYRSGISSVIFSLSAVHRFTCFRYL
jgi:hypothetical protein